MSNPLVKVIALCATEPSVPAGAERVQINLDDAAVAGAMPMLAKPMRAASAASLSGRSFTRAL